VIAAPPRAAAHTGSLLLVLTTLAALACGDASHADPSRKGPRGSVEQESGGEVVIAPPDAPYRVAAVPSPGKVTGTVSLKSPLTLLPPVSTGRDSALCGPAIADSSLQQKGGTGLGNVVVWIEGVRAGRPLPIERRLELESADCMLTPRVQGAVIGSAVNVIGHDEFRQHLRFIAGGDTAARTVVLLGRDEQVIPTNLPFKSPGMVIIHDTDHPWPRAYIAVFDHPYFAITARDGSFSIDGLPPGKYTLATWHERTGKHEQPVEVTAKGTTSVKIEIDTSR
jgi:hypothetical protein